MAEFCSRLEVAPRDRNLFCFLKYFVWLHVWLHVSVIEAVGVEADCVEGIYNLGLVCLGNFGALVAIFFMAT